ncbi:hypothetical protein [Mesorhizobium sp.]|uniref:hypothetical protein n=1 Tax=Mesorhizobium sp. TaxID=1871066 RepID=UPI00260080B9|nr:hypothetical protein [Mesorhizobium sp.]
MAEILSRLHTLLREVRDEAGNSFSGVGLLVSSAPDDLPTVPLRQTRFLPDRRSTLDCLVEISHQTSELHDGFHVLSPELDLTRVSLYFSPPIVAGLGVDPIRRVGGRYVAALFGSTLAGIIATGVASPRYGVAVFHRGKEISAEP